MAERPHDDAQDEGEPIGIFPTWRRLYATVIVYWVLLVAVLYTLTLLLDAGRP